MKAPLKRIIIHECHFLICKMTAILLKTVGYQDAHGHCGQLRPDRCRNRCQMRPVAVYAAYRCVNHILSRCATVPRSNVLNFYEPFPVGGTGQ